MAASKTISLHEVTFHPSSVQDPNGRLFFWKGEIYRGLTREWIPVFEQLSQRGLLSELNRRKLLIESTTTPYSQDRYSVVVHHRAVPFVSYPNEWCPQMFKDATLVLLDLLIELAPHELTLQDCHLGNVLFDAANPIFVDLTSIVPLRAEESWERHDAFRRQCIYPLILMAQGRGKLARCIMQQRFDTKEYLRLIRGSRQ